jgi:hypothetical protein
VSGVKTGWIVLIVSSLAVAAVGGATAARKPRDAKQLAGVNFISSCRFSHRAPDDPIVYPGQPGLSHDHSFVGNDSTNAFSTVESLRAASTTCRRVNDTAGYWMPTLLQNGTPVAPVGASIYYRRRSLDRVRAFPPGLKMIAGDSKALTPQSMRITYWNCGAQAGLPPSNSVPTCPPGRASSLRLHVNFPSCWDGKSLDSADHKSHMAYPMAGACPASHPVAVPAISLIYRYPIAGGPGITLSSGGQFSAHADFFNGWNQGALERLTNQCLNALRHCAQGGPRG